MRTRILSIDDEPDALAVAAKFLRDGELVAFPTETVYGLGVDARNPDAVRKIYEAKGRPEKNPLIVHIASPRRLQDVVADWPETARRLTDRFWPGPLTVVVRKSATIPDIVTGGGGTVGVRWPAHPVAAKLIELADIPLAAPSANRSTELSPTRADHVLRSLDGRIPLILDGGPTTAGIESTVVDLSGPIPRLLRPGPIPLPELQAILGEILVPGESFRADRSNLSPGLMEKHYSPRTPLFLVSRSEIPVEPDVGTGLILLSKRDSDPPEAIQMSANPVEYARDLFRILHDLDRRNLTRILVERPPETEAWRAVLDRLTRAAVRH